VTRREVRVTAGFFDQLDAQLPAERTATGTPSRGDILAIELLSIMHRFAVAFDALPEVVEGASGARMLLAPACRCTPSPCPVSSPTTERSTWSASPSTSTAPATRHLGVGRRPGSPAAVLVKGGGHGEQGELLGAGGADGQRLPGSGTPGTTRAHLEPVDGQRPAGAPTITHTDAAVTFALDDRALAPSPARTVAPADTVTRRQAQGRQLRSPGRCHRAEGTAG
jgi:hypothetical protein